MNKQMMYIIRIVLGGFLAFIGIRLLIQITDQRPTDTVPLGLFAGAVIIIGAVNALFSFRKLWMMLKADDSAADREGAQGENKEQQYSETMHRNKAAMVNIMDPEHSDDETEEKRMEEKETEEKQTSDAEDADSGSDDEKEESDITEMNKAEEAIMEADKAEGESDITEAEKAGEESDIAEVEKAGEESDITKTEKAGEESDITEMDETEEWLDEDELTEELEMDFEER